MELSIVEIAKRLDLNSETLQRWIRQGSIPINSKGGIGIFNEQKLIKWAEKQRLSYKVPSQKESGSQEHGDLMLVSAMELGGVYSGISGADKEGVLKSVVDLVPDIDGATVRKLHAQLMEREQLSSTGIGNGVAIPHPRNPLKNGFKKPMILTCFPEKSIDFKAIDDMPVFVLFLLLSPDVEFHLNLLSRLSFCLRDNSFIDFLKQTPSTDTLLSRVEILEENIGKEF